MYTFPPPELSKARGARTINQKLTRAITSGAASRYLLHLEQTFCIAKSLNVAYWLPAMIQTEVRITVLAPHWPAGAPRSRGSSLQYATWSSQPGMHQCRILQKRTVP